MSFFECQNLKLISISLFLAVACLFQFGYVAYVNPAADSFKLFINESYFHNYGSYLTDSAFTWIFTVVVNAYQVGLLIGTLLTPCMVEKLGRKYSLLATSLFDVVGTATLVVAVQIQLPLLLVIGRLIIGIGSGVSIGAVTLYLQEISPTPLRGLLSSFIGICASALTIPAMVLGLPKILGNDLTFLLSICFIAAPPKLILFWCPESPKFLLLKRSDVAGARKAVAFFHGTTVNIDDVIREFEKEGLLEEQSGSTLELLAQVFKTPHLRKAVLLGVVSMIALNTSGMIPLSLFSTTILEDIHVDANLALLATVLISLVNTLTTIVSMFLVEKYGRRSLLLFGLICVVCVLVGVMVSFIVAPMTSSPFAGYAAAALIVADTGVFGFGPGVVPWFITSELVPQSHRSISQSLANVANVLTSFVVSFAFLPTFDALGAYAFLLLLIGPTCLCAIYLYIELPETKNREISDIVLDLKKRK